MTNNKTVAFFLISICLFCFFFPAVVKAADFKTDYEVQYYPELSKSTVSTLVSFKITVTNLKTDLYIKTFSLSFPKSFSIGNIKISDQYGPIKENINQTDTKQTLTMDFNNPQVGMNITNTLYIDFLQSNLFTLQGNVWEVILPTVENKEMGDYSVIVNLPVSENKKIAIAKPRPNSITRDQIIWKNPSQKTIYAVFGNTQYYKTQLRYHLDNPNISRVYTDIAFPPDTLYQKVYVNSIIPEPDKVYRDIDGNYMARFFLNPHEQKEIYFDGSIELFSQPRDNLMKVIKDEFKSQKKYLLSEDPNWRLPKNDSKYKFDSVKQIYTYVVSTLKYNYGRLNTKISRLGSIEALKYPDQAVCSEFSDVFIAIARENGFPVRELQGYAFSHDPELRPFSTQTDVLHSWVEYYNEEKNSWISVDPTWESTSGIDYFSSLDLNHIVFAIHGKKSDYPYPAGSYKNSNETKDIQISAQSSLPVEQKNLTVLPLKIPLVMSSSKTFVMKTELENRSNITLWNVPLVISAEGTRINYPELMISSILPREKKELEISFSLINSFKENKLDFHIYTDQNLVGTIPVSVVPLTWMIIRNLGILGIGIIILLVIRKLVKK